MVPEAKKKKKMKEKSAALVPAHHLTASELKLRQSPEVPPS